MNILYFNTLFGNVELMLNKRRIVIDEKKQSEYLVGGLERILEESKLGYGDIDYFATIIGSGNFTNIKTNIAVGKALQFATGKNIIGSDLFEIISWKKEYDYVVVQINPTKYHIKNKNGDYIVANDIDELSGVILKEYSNDNWKLLTEYKIKNKIFKDLEPLYVENASITKRKLK
jgi:tRNA A37 threonylcarbamoyladenosine modification protein TsaB